MFGCMLRRPLGDVSTVPPTRNVLAEHPSGTRPRAVLTELQELIEKAGEEGIPDLVHILRNLATENIPNLPPGGGLASKHSVIEAVYNRLNPQRDDDGVSERFL
ncbi:protein phosphatase 1B isoform X1 [Tachysurus ichikawai]